MTDEEHDKVNHHLQEALDHLNKAQEGNLRQTNNVAVNEVATTLADILRERKRDE